ncbi:protein MpLEA-like16 [Marchantia polymorpha subsp. ruderalis]|uniref:Uncharacterized protein n=2 Tax=Marchantia polymorpha TaxID=3197 RepID=A0AAF6B430_MARPO|nr:hypothetical protein MARPO_0121s0048 [Marchantia polymorpha]BBN06764.1 hypothetical protein Mp_3g23740 [Marchantia polymorpha subsp. ruderalis]|eukprot:PTQ30711.1 hypothetical protein MARPO_0121s0048 [Marchantia polymorpha]
MQAAKNMAGMIKHKVEDAAATAEEKADIAKAEAEEKVEKLKSHDDASKIEATKKKNEKKRVAEETKEKKIEEHNSEHGGVGMDNKKGPIGDCPTPADLDMAVDNPSLPAMNSGMNSTVIPQSITSNAGPLTGQHLIRK